MKTIWETRSSETEEERQAEHKRERTLESRKYGWPVTHTAPNQFVTTPRFWMRRPFTIRYALMCDEHDEVWGLVPPSLLRVLEWLHLLRHPGCRGSTYGHLRRAPTPEWMS